MTCNVAKNTCYGECRKSYQKVGTDTATTVLLGFTGSSLLDGVIGNLFILMASMAERIREIGILLAIISSAAISVKFESYAIHRAARLNFIEEPLFH